MIIRNLEDLESQRVVAWGNGLSRRLLVKLDGMKFSLTDTLIEAGSVSPLHYMHHLEACYCIEGEGSIEDLSGTVHEIKPGVLYALDQHDPHILRAKTNMRLICVFYPALVGDEVHQISAGEKFSTYPATY